MTDTVGGRPPHRRRVGGVPLAVYVTILLAIPLAALTVIGMREVGRNIREARNARSVAETVEVQTAAINILAPLQIERITLSGTARIDELGLGRESVLGTIGSDFIRISEDNVGDLDRDLDTLDGALGDAEFDSAAELQQRLADARQDLDDVRTSVDAEEATPSDVTGVFEEFERLVDEIVRDSEASARSDQPVVFNARELSLAQSRARDILRTASGETVAIAETMIGLRTLDESALLRLAAIHDAALVEELAVADQETREALIEARRDLSDYLDEWAAAGGVPTPDRVQIAPELYQEFALLLTERLDYLARVEQFSRDVSNRIVVLTDEVADDAENDINRTIGAIGLIALGALGLQFMIVRSFTGPMRRLRRGAEMIGEGVFELDELPLHGPTDVRHVTAAVNDMAATLSLVDQQVKMLASGDPKAGFGNDLPGEVGTSLRESVERLAVLSETLQQSEERLQQEARLDALTGLPNRFGLLELLDARLSDPTAAAPTVMIVDLDGFKSVNDTSGHDIGDTVLRVVADRVRELVGDTDVAARIGGDEFLLVFARSDDADEALLIGQQVIDAIEQPCHVGELRLSLSASVGVKMLEGGSTSLAALKDADAALYHAKRLGGGKVEMFDEALQALIEQEAEVEFALRRGIGAGELRLHLQPAVDLRTGFACGAEALVRWDDGDGQLRAPGEFIQIAERSGLIIDIGRWVMHAACERLVEWERRDVDRPLRLAINVSGRHLMQGDLLGDLDDAFAATGADPRMLEIELTESHLLDDIERVCDLLDGVRERGIAVSVDDFGTGYSSMTYLQQFPLDTVKIDQRFIAGATDRRYDATVVESIVRLAQAVDLEVIAEGVETTEQLEYVHRQGIDKVQGYLLARPMAVADAEAVIFGGPMIDPSTLG